MKKLKLKNFLTGFGIFTILLTLLPFLPSDYWWIRMWDFPHLQLTFLTLAAAFIYIIKFDFRAWRDYTFIGILIVCTLYQFTQIYPYTEFADFEVLNSKKDAPTLKIFTSNVLQKNEEHHLLNTMYKSYDADIMLFTETDKIWMNAIKEKMSASYTSQVEVPKDNTYGMLLYSKYELFDVKVNYFVSDSIPSIEAKIKLTEKDIIQLYAIHPTPPMPQENPLSTDRDAEMMMIAKLALESNFPVIVVGDFNDVAWSPTSKLFQNVSRLIDVRKGRGLYNTYNAHNFLMRWPLDHIFISSDFKLTHVERCDDIKSDHFPLFTEISYEPEDIDSQQLPYPSDEELKRAQLQIDKFYEEKLKQ